MKYLALILAITLSACSSKEEPIVVIDSASVEAAAQLSLISGNPAFGEIDGNKTVIFSIRNTGTTASEIPTPSLSGANPSAFSIILASGCAAALPKNGTCTVRVNFSSVGKAGGNYSASLNLGSTPALSIPLTASVALPPAAAYEIYDGSLELDQELGINFGNILGSQAPAKILTVKNVGAVTSPALNVDLTNNSFNLSNNTCQNKVLAPNQSCSFKILFTTADKAAQIYLSDILIEDIVFPLAATVLAPLANDDPESGVVIETYVNNEPLTAADLNLGLLPNNQGIAKVLTFKNVGTKTSTPMTAALSENNNFFIVSNQCYEKVLAPGQSCSFRLIFSAVAKTAGSYNVSLTFPGVDLPITGEVLPTDQCPVDTHLEGAVCEANVKACSIENGVGAKTWNGSTYGACTIVSCNSTFHEEGGSCLSDLRSCVIANGVGQESWLGNQWSSCTVQSCEASFHAHNNQCDADVLDCTSSIDQAASATQTWDQGNEVYGACDLQSCNSSYHEESNACLADVQDCVNEAPNSTAATKTWNGATYDTCEITACESGYLLQDNACNLACAENEHYNEGLAQCEANVVSCVGEIPHASAATKTWDGSAYGDCIASACTSPYAPVPNGSACAIEEMFMSFGGIGSAAGYEYWKTDGTNAGTSVFYDHVAGANPGVRYNIGEAVELNGKIVYYADGGKWWVANKVNPTTPTMLIDSYNNDFGFQFLTLSGDGTKAFMNAWTPTSWGQGVSPGRLYVTDGTAGGTAVLASTGSPGSQNMYITGFGPGVLYFDSGLKYSDGTVGGTVLVKSGLTVTAYQTAGRIVVGNKMFFAANDGTNGNELWMTDGTTAGTVMLSNINPGVASSTPGMFVDNQKSGADHKIYFNATTATLGTELYAISNLDSPTPTVALVADINAGSGSSTPGQLIKINANEYVFAAADANGRELFKYNDSTNTVSLIKDINSGAAASNPTFYGLFNGQLYFNATTAANGSAIWRTDGTHAGTTLFYEYSAGATSDTFGGFLPPGYLDGKVLGDAFYAPVNVMGGYMYFYQWVSGGVQRLFKTDGTTVSQVMATSNAVPSQGLYSSFYPVRFLKTE